MQKFIAIALGGSVGALLRYSVSGFAHKYLGAVFPWGTLTVNLAGCFVIGLLWELFDYYIVPGNMRIFLLTGILGAFTTFSTFGLETINLLRDGESRLAFYNIVFSVVFGLLLVFIGIVVARFLISIIR
jgi:CrcB protein